MMKSIFSPRSVAAICQVTAEFPNRPSVEIHGVAELAIIK